MEVLAANFLAPVAMVFLYYRLTTRDFREVGRAYPTTGGEKSQYCGAYLQGRWVYCGMLNISVNKAGLELKWVFFPFVFPIRSSIPWSEVILRQSADRIVLGFSGAPTCDVRLPKAALSLMQFHLHGRVPFGHVL